MSSKDQDLVKGALAGDPQAVRQLVDLLTPVIQHRAARAMSRRPDAGARDVRQAVEDFTQEVFLSLFDDGGRALRAWDPARGLSLKNFVGLLTERQVISIMRSGRRGAWAEDAVGQDRIDALPRKDAEADARVASRQTLAQLLDRLRESLSPRGLELFHRLFVNQESVASVSASTGMTAGAVHAWRSRIGRLARRLGQEIEQETASEPQPRVSEVPASSRSSRRHVRT